MCNKNRAKRRSLLTMRAFAALKTAQFFSPSGSFGGEVPFNAVILWIVLPDHFVEFHKMLVLWGLLKTLE